MTLEELWKDARATKRARKAALLQYANAHDHFAEREQMLLLEGKDVAAIGARVLGQSVLRSYVAEVNDPRPRQPA